MEKLKKTLWRPMPLIGCLLLSISLLLIPSAFAYPQNSANTAVIDVSITESGFDPEITIISAGSTVRWQNNMSEPISLRSTWGVSQYFPIAYGPRPTVKKLISSEEISTANFGASKGNTPWFSQLELEPGDEFLHTFIETGDYTVQIDAQIPMSSVVRVMADDPDQPSGPTDTTATVTITSTGIPITSTTPFPSPTATPFTLPALPTFTPTATATGPTSTPLVQLPTSTPKPSSTPNPTNTQSPDQTVTPDPTHTPSPTQTPTSQPTETPLPPHQIQVVLNTNPADGTNIEFLLDDDFQFELDSDEIEANDNDQIGNKITFKQLETGAHTIELVNASNFTLDTVTCSSSTNNDTFFISGGDVSLDLRPNEQIVCTYALLKDSDFDRLADIHETGTNVYASPTNTGTDPFNRDTDADGLLDGDEVLGSTRGLNLPAMGANPLRKTLLVEYDWVEDSQINKGVCTNGPDGFHTHKPSQEMINRVRAVYAAAPVSNPDGSNGIDIIQDYGQGGLFNGGNLIFRDGDGLIEGVVAGSAYNALKSANFASNREGYFHYAIMAHQYFSTNNFSSGQAEIGGDDIIISIYNYNCSDDLSSYAAVHEIGHNLGLRHGGHDDINNKPNYNSVMNYKFQFSGIDSNESCDGIGDGINGYSTGWRPMLNERDLNEANGVCGPSSTAVDWNNNGNPFDNNVLHDINSDGSFDDLEDHDDWGRLFFYGPLNGVEIGGRLSALDRPLELSHEPPIPDNVFQTGRP